MGSNLIGGYYDHRTLGDIMRLASVDTEKDQVVLVCPEQFGKEDWFGFIKMWCGSIQEFNQHWRLLRGEPVDVRD